MIRHVVLQCSRFSKTPMEFFMDEPIGDLIAWVDLMREVSREEERQINRK